VTPSFHGLRVLTFESRRATELASLISSYGGEPLSAPALREVPLESNSAAVQFAAKLLRGEFDFVIFLTGVGTRALVEVMAHVHPREILVDALARARVVARGPKPLAVLRELKVPVWVAAPEPNTWHELLAAIDARLATEQTGSAGSGGKPLEGSRIAVQEYGISNVDFLDALRARGAEVTPVPVYRWALPEDVEPLRKAAAAVSGGGVDVVIWTTSVQVVHFWQIVREMGLEAEVRHALARTVMASIGPTTSEELGRHGLTAHLEASHPKIGFLVREAAEQVSYLVRAKRGNT
jgi:uroporphyrinogen-III synthase